MQKKLLNDLEIIDDGEFVLLRRHSAKLVPVFCFFQYTISDLQEGQLEVLSNDSLKLPTPNVEFVP